MLELAVWLSGNALVSINEVTLRRAPVSTGMGDRLWAGKPSQTLSTNQPPRSTQPEY